jgi:hypothetical protein
LHGRRTKGSHDLMGLSIGSDFRRAATDKKGGC